ncbi:polyketide-type polyunsaturated fatty acid synthase PfaA [Actinopolyspora alba]|uniref:Polyketide-type polyunsaturated fatty acid synthase PfaA n=1 Tax=Actinopolyspora alba TaxID=673379 RepID=A0A1I2AD71_9ACTN|nr:type I polyketide synthase [Actinopolyspora alba]SFE40923.1 polyketide-type polyunsaturated fatty acid synthase PfaA [Actinopolyspora alba]
MDHRIAIVGVSAIMPGAPDVDAFWRNVLEGRDLMTDVPADRWLIEDFYDPDPDAQDKTYARRGAFLPEVEFDPMALGVPPRNLPATDTAQLLALVAAERLLTGLSDAGLGRIDGERVSVFLGCASLQLLGEMAMRSGRPQWRRTLLDSGLSEADADAVCDRILEYSPPWQEATFPGMLSNVVAGRIANRFDLHGTNFTVDSACASSLAALSVSVDDLLLGRSDMVITGGVDTLNDAMTFQCFSKTPALSPTGDCRPFDEHADGTMLGEGLGLFALKRLADAERDGDRVHAVIRGIGSSSDGSGTSVYAPLDTGQARALRRAYETAGYGPDTVGLVEAHGTGTAPGDATETAALHSVFEASGRTDRQWCALGSVKSQIGHTKAAAGAAGLLKAALALRHKVLPPTIKVDRPNPALNLENSPLYLNTRARPWINTTEHPRRASVSSFGFGGSNFHVTLEEYTDETAGARPAVRCEARPGELVVLSAATPRELFSLDLSGSLTAVARRSQNAFQHTREHRLAVVASSAEDLEQKLEQARGLVGTKPFSTPSGLHYGVGRTPGRIAFLFPGQGAQYVGMGADLAMHFPQAHAVWDRHEISPLVFPPPVFTDAERQAQQHALTDTGVAQPAIAAHSLALLNVLETAGVRPDCVAGHSFGELVGLHAARAFDEDTLMRLAARRGELMREGSGVMIALDAGVDEVTSLLEQQNLEQAWIANHNGPRQVVVAATAEAGALVRKHATAAGMTARTLDTSAAFHSPLVAPATEPLRDFLSAETVRAPLLNVYGNAAAAVHPVRPTEIRQAIADHVASPVRFADMVHAMHADGVRIFLEVGPGGALTSLVKENLSDGHAISLDRASSNGVTGLLDALGQLTALGVPLDFAGLWHGPEEPEPARPAMPIMINGGNHGGSYPPTSESAPSTPAPALSGTGSGSQDDGTLRAVAEAQQEVARAHAAYLSMAEKSIDALTSLDPASGHGLGQPSAPSPTFRTTTPPPAPAEPPASPGPPATSESPAVSVAPVPATAPEPVPSRGIEELEPQVLAAVAEKTGYPVEILEPHMELEADLGLDSITRAQVLSALRPMFPQLEGMERERLTPLLTLRTLGEIADRLRELLNTPAHPGTTAPDRTIHRHVPTLRRAPAPGSAMQGLGTVLVTDDGTGVAEETARLLTERGVHARVGTAADITTLEADGLVLLGGLAETASADEALAIQRDAFRAAQEIAPRLRAVGGVFVTVQDTGGGFGHRDAQRPWIGGLAALARTVRWEWPLAAVKAIDCQRANRSATETATALVDELLTGGPDLDVALAADGTRWTLDTTEAPEKAASGEWAGDWEADPVIVVSGGTGAVTAAALRELGSRHRARFVLLGRGSDREVDGLDQARYMRVDVRDENAVRTALADVRQQWGPITGVVHAAGVLNDQRVEDKTEGQFEAVFSTKVDGLRALLDATREDPLRLLCVFSSVVAATGNAGQCDYAMANETLNHVLATEQNARPDAVVRSLLWGPWEGGMVTPELAEVFRLGGVDLIPLRDGARVFARELSAPADDPRVLLTAGRTLTRLGEATNG